MRVGVRIHGVVVVLALEKFAGVAIHQARNVCAPLVLLGLPRRKTAPAFSPPRTLLLLFSSFLRAPDLAPFVWVRVAGLLGSWVLGCLPKHFLGKTATISHHLRCFLSPEDKASIVFLLDTSNSNSPLHASTAASNLLPTGSITPAIPCLSA